MRIGIALAVLLCLCAPSFANIVNGSFETGNFAGWTTVTTGSPFRPWAVSGAGAGGGFGMATTSPQDGAFVAWNGFDGGGPMEFQMYQDVLVPTGGARLDWKWRAQWNFGLGGATTQPRTFHVEIRNPATNAVLATLLTFSTGTAVLTGDTGWTSSFGDISAFGGQTVRVYFFEDIPQSFTGPGQIEFDAISITPEPASLALLGAGVVVLVRRRRRK